jgi:hypothetical protein
MIAHLLQLAGDHSLIATTAKDNSKSNQEEEV